MLRVQILEVFIKRQSEVLVSLTEPRDVVNINASARRARNFTTNPVAQGFYHSGVTSVMVNNP